MTDSIDLKRIRHLVLLSEELHFSRAAERANLSQTAFSRSIQSLEADLGVRLFDRDTRSVVLTAAGRQLLASGRELLGCAGRLLAEANHIAQAEGGELNFGAGMMAANLYLGDALTTLRKRIPKLAIKVEVNHWNQLVQRLEQDQIEFFVAFTCDPARKSDPRFEITPLPAAPASVFCRAGHPLLAQQAPITREQLLEYPWSSVLFDETAPVQLRELLGLPDGTVAPLALGCNDLQLLRTTTLGSDALLFTWQAWLEEDLHTGAMHDMGALLQPGLPDGGCSIASAIVTHAGRTLSPIARQAIALIKAAA
ncbi:LysR family transcriptional regulator [Pseudomonas alkylphenolica]|uniref:LysR family transcriptional regulator n=1 Tax=Pseudomonas alkylphenolica TaxID=237609 RepID=A0A443ZX19_9PSED|nr:LysR family transcriptional regulator [Pseudomonas alkylphenolica]RWU25519.1 LysR family transcriptional regulator [Pseudomonas alkylphenolica]